MCAALAAVARACLLAVRTAARALLSSCKAVSLVLRCLFEDDEASLMLCTLRTWSVLGTSAVEFRTLTKNLE